jgi:eukaryotic-like serine/threonine-protein kinase
VVDCGGNVPLEVVLIPAGSFQMGTAATGYAQLVCSRPVHTVTFSKDFYIGKYEVTQYQYQAVMGTNPSFFTNDLNNPVADVTWEKAVEFCQALSLKSGRTVRLPSEAEWEYACKGDQGNVDTTFSYGSDVAQLVNYAWYNLNANNATHVVGLKLPNSLGLYDMMGNVVEWCQDVWHNDYGSAPNDGSAWTLGGDQSHHVGRGGAWAYDPDFCRSAVRYWISTIHPDGVVGFRVVVEK